VSAYGVTVSALLVACFLAAAIEPPLAYMAPLVASAWLVLAWCYKRETAPRYRRKR